jgi:hypothetical protein
VKFLFQFALELRDSNVAVVARQVLEHLLVDDRLLLEGLVELQLGVVLLTDLLDFLLKLRVVERA